MVLRQCMAATITPLRRTPTGHRLRAPCRLWPYLRAGSGAGSRRSCFSDAPPSRCRCALPFVDCAVLNCPCSNHLLGVNRPSIRASRHSGADGLPSLDPSIYGGDVGFIIKSDGRGPSTGPGWTAPWRRSDLPARMLVEVGESPSRGRLRAPRPYFKELVYRGYYSHDDVSIRRSVPDRTPAEAVEPARPDPAPASSSAAVRQLTSTISSSRRQRSR